MFAPWKKSHDEPRRHTKEQRHCFANKGPIVKAIVFPVVMYGCESWTIRKAELQRIDAFKLWFWRRLLRVSWTARRSNQPKGNKPGIVIGKTDAEAEAPTLWSPDVKNQLIGKDCYAEKV